MTAARRWWSVGVGVLLLVASPVLVRMLPAADEDVSAAALLERVQDSRSESFSGLAESSGNVALPKNDALSSLTGLLGDSQRNRVWWRDARTWRVATLRTTGETDLVHRGDRTVRWVYESKRATMMPDVPVRLPNAADLLPHELARRSLSGVRASELSRIPARRVAGRDALGLRLTPAGDQAGIGRVDVYADRTSGVPLRVELFARGSRTPALTSAFVDFSLGSPSADTLRFVPPDDARLSFDQVVDLAAAADRFAARVPPASLATLPSRRSPLRDQGSVGVYGRGPTVLLAVPLWRRTAHRVRDDLEGQPGVQAVPAGLLLGAPPVRMLLAEPESNGTSWLLAGTVTEQALADAATELADDRPALRGFR